MPDLAAWAICACLVALIWALAAFDVENRVFWWGWRHWVAPHLPAESPQVVISGDLRPESASIPSVLASSERLERAHAAARPRLPVRR